MRVTTACLLLILFTVIPMRIHGSDNAADRQIAAIEKKLNQVSGQERLAVLLQAAGACDPEFPEKVLQYGREALALARQFGDRLAEIESRYEIGVAYDLQDKNELARENLQVAFDEAEKEKEKEFIGKSANALANVHIKTADYGKALGYSNKALKMSEESGDKEELAKAFNNLGTVFRIQGKSDEALACFQKALKIDEEIGIKSGIAASLNNIGNLFYILGKYDQTLEYYQKSLSIREEIGDKGSIARSLNNIGNVYNALGNYAQSLAFFQKSLEIKEEIGDRSGIANSSIGMGNICISLGEFDRALGLYKKALKIHEQIGKKTLIALSLMNIGLTYSNLGKYDQALAYHQQSLKIREEIGEKSGIAQSLYNIGLINRYIGRYDRALEYYQKALLLETEIGGKSSMADCLNSIGILYCDLKKYNDSLEYHQKSLKIRLAIGKKFFIAQSLNNIGNVYNHLGQYSKALEYLQKALILFRQIGAKSNSSYSLNSIGTCLVKLHKFKEAENYFEQSLIISKEVKDSAHIIDIYLNLSELFADWGDFKKALQYYQEYHKANEAVFNEKSAKQINELQARYEADKKEKEIELLKKDNELAKQKGALQKIGLQKQILLRNSFFTGFLLVLVIFVLVFKKYLYFFAFWKKEKYIGRYRLLDVIGSGGMSVVYKAHSIKEKRERVAMKILRQEFAGDDSIIKRFKQEAVIIDKLDHPNIVKVHERGEDKNRLFIAMEYLEGKTLAEKIAKESPIALDVCLHIMSQLADALVQIHAKKIIHRDLKPSNIILTCRNGDANFVKLLDFGLARMRFQSTLTQTGELLGTIGYMSPEQLLDKEITVASDIYSLGVIFYETVCGRRAFAADNEIQIIQKILEEMPAEPRSIRSEIPAEWNLLILKMIDKQPHHRATLADFRERLKNKS